MATFENIGQLPPASLIEFVRVLSKNNFGDSKLLVDINKAIYDKQNHFNVVDFAILMTCLNELDRVTVDVH